MQEENGWGSNSQEKALAREPEMKLRLEGDRPPRARLEKLCFPTQDLCGCKQGDEEVMLQKEHSGYSVEKGWKPQDRGGKGSERLLPWSRAGKAGIVA